MNGLAKTFIGIIFGASMGFNVDLVMDKLNSEIAINDVANQINNVSHNLDAFKESATRRFDGLELQIMTIRGNDQSDD